MKTTIDAIRESVALAAKEMPIRRVYLFGSRSRGDSHEESDIDLCVEASSGFSLIDAGLFGEAVGRMCNLPVDVVSDRFMTPTTKANVNKDKVLLYER